jgi:ABC-type nitrate/sulfonate/bicarbonate transport system substrate-binding protein
MGALALTPIALATGCASTAPPTPAKLRVKVFPGAQNLPLYAALGQGQFARRGLEVELLFTLNSVELRDDLARGAVQIVHTAVDNAVAMREVAGHDIVIFMGGDDSFNELFVQPDIASVEQLRGKTLAVDAPDTAYALQARKILLDRGLKPGDYRLNVVGGTFQRIKAMQDDRSNTASMLNPPFSLQAKDAGLKSLGSVSQLIGPYQASGGFAMRAWAHASGEVLERYIAAYVEALRWSVDPANREACVAMLMERLKLARSLAERTYAVVVDPLHGFARDARFDDAGFANVLKLRAELEGRGTVLRADRYVDLSWYDKAMRRLGG